MYSTGDSILLRKTTQRDVCPSAISDKAFSSTFTGTFAPLLPYVLCSVHESLQVHFLYVVSS